MRAKVLGDSHFADASARVLGELRELNYGLSFVLIRASSSHSTQQVISLKDKSASVLRLHSCLTLCDPVDSSTSGSSVHWILQARILA